MVQTQIAQAQDDPQARLVRAHLARAKEALEVDNLQEARDFFEKALAVKGQHPQRVIYIQRALKQYSDQVIEQQQPPDWDQAHRAFDLLGSLLVEDDQTREWQRALWLKQANFLLEQGNLAEGFGIFNKLRRDYGHLADQDDLKAEISRIVQLNVWQRAAQRDWPLLRQMIEHVQAQWPPGDQLRNWLETISEALAAADQVRAGQEQMAHQNNELSRQKQQLITQKQQLTRQNEQLTGQNEQLANQNEQLIRQLEKLTGATEQSQKYNRWLLGAFFILAAVAYIVVIL